MPILHPAPVPDFNIIRLSHIELGVTDLAAAKAFYVDTLGLRITEETSDTLYLRCLEERNHHSFMLTQQETPIVKRMAYKMASEADLDRIAAHFESKNLPVKWVEKHAQGRTFQTHDTLGMPLEFYFQMEQVERSLQHYGEYIGVHPLRIDHFNCFTPDVQASHDFYVGDLGFKVTEYTETDDPEREQQELWAIWMHRKGGVHDVAFTSGSGPRLHHAAIYVPSAMNIIHLCDVMATTGYLENMERGPGRHGISNAFFLYVRDPDGHRIEIYASDYLTVDPDFEPIKWDLHDPQRQTLWGQPAPRSWFEEGSRFEGVNVQASNLDAKPIVAP
ncbi:MAG: 3,4-dihydroxyphenylacetate 2,3-dioxygenase [Aggregatilineales bacterium]